MKKLSALLLAISLVFSTLNVNTVFAEGLPAAPVLSTTGHVQQNKTGDLRISWSTFKGTGGTYWFLLENDETIHEATIQLKGPSAQAASVQLTNRPSGEKVYQVFLCNDVGCTESLNTLEVSIDNPNYLSRLKAPGKPVIGFVDVDHTEGNYAIDWNMWGGVNGSFWTLEENGFEVFRGELLERGALPQNGSAPFFDRDSGRYVYVVRLCLEIDGGEALCNASQARTVELERPGQPIVDVPPAPPVPVELTDPDFFPEIEPVPSLPPQVLPEEQTSPEDQFLLENPFSDLQWGDDYYDSALKAHEQGWLRGNPDGTVRLSDSINRADFVQMVLKAFNIPVRQLPYGMTTFRDVESGVWFENALFTASRNGMISCCGDYDFRPWDNLIKAEALRMVLDVAAFDYSLAEPQYSDVGIEWYSGYASFSKRLNLIDADAEGRLHPFAEMTRGEAVELISRVLSLG